MVAESLAGGSEKGEGAVGKMPPLVHARRRRQRRLRGKGGWLRRLRRVW